MSFTKAIFCNNVHMANKTSIFAIVVEAKQYEKPWQ